VKRPRTQRAAAFALAGLAFAMTVWGCASSPKAGPSDEAVVEGNEPTQAPAATEPAPSVDPTLADAGPNVGPDGSTACGEKDGLEVFCVAPGGSHRTSGTIVYGAGFPDGLPALGIGAPKLGYIPVSYPFVCQAKGGAGAISDHNVADGKICEAIFENTVSAEVSGKVDYVITAGVDAGTGDYLFGLTTNVGARFLEPNFWIRIGGSPSPPRGPN
jgi:hypothetical protein